MIEVADEVPADLATVVAGSEVPVVVHLAAPSHLAGDALAGWEIGAATAALLAGAATVTGIDAARLARVRAVVHHLRSPDPATTGSAPAPDREAVR